MKNVFICGAHSTGKTTLHDYLRKNLKVNNGKILYSDEVARKLLQENNVTGETLLDPEVFTKYNLLISQEQHRREEEMANRFEDTPSTKLCVFDRGIIDPVCYLRMTAGGEEFANETLEQSHVSTLVKRLQNKQISIVFIMKPYKKYQKKDNLRIDYDFDDICNYDEIMQSMMTSLNIDFHYIKDDDLIKRAKYVTEIVSSLWPEINLCLNTTA